jgi:hypothetical protein
MTVDQFAHIYEDGEVKVGIFSRDGVIKVSTKLTDPFLKELPGKTLRAYEVMEKIYSNHTSLEEKGFLHIKDMDGVSFYTDSFKDLILQKKYEGREICVGYANEEGFTNIFYYVKIGDRKVGENVFRTFNSTTGLADRLVSSEKYLEATCLEKAIA